MSYQQHSQHANLNIHHSLHIEATQTNVSISTTTSPHHHHQHQRSLSLGEADTSTDSVTQPFDDLLRCFICLSQLSQPHLCPHCSKICCYTCISKWLNERKSCCPHCRLPLTTQQLVNCRFMNDVALALTALQKQKQATTTALSLPRSDPSTQCSIHIGSELLYYCLTCSVSICSDCVIIDQSHRNHNISKLNVVAQSHMDLLRGELSALEYRQQHAVLVEQQIEANIAAVKRAKDERSAELQAYCSAIETRQNNTLKSKVLTLLAAKGELLKESRLCENLIEQLNAMIVQPTPAALLVSKTSSILELLQQVHSKHVSTLFTEPVDTYFESETVPNYINDTFSFMLDCEEVEPQQSHGAAADDDSHEILYSPAIRHNGHVFRLKVYRRGNGIAKDVFLSVFLELTSSYYPGTATSASAPTTSAVDETGASSSSNTDAGCKYEYSVTMHNHISTDRNVTRTFSSHFEQSECWGYNRFSRLSTMRTDGFVDDDGKVTLTFRVRSPSYLALAHSQQRYIKHMEQVNASQQLQLHKLQTRVQVLLAEAENCAAAGEELHYHSMHLAAGAGSDGHDDASQYAHRHDTHSKASTPVQASNRDRRIVSDHAVDGGEFNIAHDIDQLNISDASNLLRDVDVGNLDVDCAVDDSESDLSSDDEHEMSAALATSSHSI